jgi:dihydrofolate reductase
MAKLIFSNLISLDGYFAGPGGDLSGLPMGPAFDKHNLELLRAAGTLLFGRTTFEMFQSFWPAMLKDRSADPVTAEIAALVAKADKVVVSDTLTLAANAPWRDAKVVSRKEAHDCVRALKAGGQRDILAYGSHVVMNDLMAHGLVDELFILVANLTLLDGVRLFESGAPLILSLMETRRLPQSDIVMLRYASNAKR